MLLAPSFAIGPCTPPSTRRLFGGRLILGRITGESRVESEDNPSGQSRGTCELDVSSNRAFRDDRDERDRCWREASRKIQANISSLTNSSESRCACTARREAMRALRLIAGAIAFCKRLHGEKREFRLRYWRQSSRRGTCIASCCEHASGGAQIRKRRRRAGTPEGGFNSEAETGSEDPRCARRSIVAEGMSPAWKDARTRGRSGPRTVIRLAQERSSGGLSRG